MSFQLPPLAYPADALSPIISAETIEFHYGKHHASYVSNLNRLTEGTDLANMTLEEVIRATGEGPMFNNAAQVWNHSFYWHCMTPDRGSEPSFELAKQITESFGSFEELKRAFSGAATSNFGSGWTWLVGLADGGLKVVNTSNADTPLLDDDVTPLLTCDVWEHAYYIDYRNARPAYLKAWWDVVNWSFVSERYALTGAVATAPA